MLRGGCGQQGIGEAKGLMQQQFCADEADIQSNHQALEEET